jgi:hypothetical protein
MTEQQRELEDQAGKIIWEAASLKPGTPGHAGRTAVLVEKIRQLIREAQESAQKGVAEQ